MHRIILSIYLFPCRSGHKDVEKYIRSQMTLPKYVYGPEINFTQIIVYLLAYILEGYIWCTLW